MDEKMSKKEFKKMRKIEQMRNLNLEKKANMTKWIVIGVISTIFFGFFIFLVVSLKNGNSNLANTNSTTKVLLSDSGEFRVADRAVEPVQVGQEEASGEAVVSIETRQVILTEFADMQCPACKQFHPIIKSVLDLYPDTVALNFKHFPISSIHANALSSAIAAEAAKKQEKFFEMVDLLYERQEAWADLPDPKEIFIGYAKELDLDVDQFTKDMDDPTLAGIIEAQRAEGIEAGVNSTPSFFVNGVKISNPSDISGFQVAIDAALAEVGGELPAEGVEDVDSVPPVYDPQDPQIDL